MRGTEKKQATMLTLLSPDRLVPEKDPLRKVKALADAALAELSPVFDEMYSAVGRPSIPPERLLKASLLIAFYSVRSETLFCEQLNYNLLYRWFLDMNMDEPGFVQETFSKNRERLMKHHVASLFLGKVVRAGESGGTDERRPFHRGRDADRRVGIAQELPAEGGKAGGLAAAGRQGKSDRQFPWRVEKQPDARLAKKAAGKEAKLSYAQHALQRTGADADGLVPGRRGVQPSPHGQATHRGDGLNPTTRAPAP
jgi:transposase